MQRDSIYERFFRGVTRRKSIEWRPRKSLPRYYHSDRISGFPGMLATDVVGGSAPIDQLSGSVNSRMSLASLHKEFEDKATAANAPSSQHDHPYCNQRDCFSRRFFFTAHSACKIDVDAVTVQNHSDEKNAFRRRHQDILTNL
jgi:hypothetical protein